MKRKFWLILLAVVSAACLILGVTACGEDKGKGGGEDHTHAFTWVYNNDATCTKDGTETQKCTCNETGETRIKSGSALGHDTAEVKGTATCTQAGTKSYWHCDRCGKNFEEEEGETELDTSDLSADALGHDLSFSDLREATCSAEGSIAHWHCSRCGKDFADDRETELEDVSIPKTEHEYTVENECRWCQAKWEYTEGLVYQPNADEDSYSVTGIGTASGDITLPYGYEGKPVVSVAAKAFYGNTSITGVTMPDSIITVDFYAFVSCPNLTKLNLSKGLMSIGWGAFQGCKGLKGQLIIPESVTKIGGHAFEECAGIKEVILPDSVREIGFCAFNGTQVMDGNEDFDEDGALYIGNHLIYVYMDLISKEFVVKEGTKTISNGAFGGNDIYQRRCDIVSVTIPDSVVSIGAEQSSIWPDLGTFENCSSLKTVKGGSGLTLIGDSAFSGCTDLTGELNFPNVKTIGREAFIKCECLTGIQMTNVEKIGAFAFSGCKNLTGDLDLPNVQTIEVRGFEGCGLTSVTIGDKAISIGNEVFQYCGELKSVSAGSGTIGEKAFYCCPKLIFVTLSVKVTSIGYDIFYQEHLTATNITYGGTLEQWYKVAPNWGFRYFNRYCVVKCTDGTINSDLTVTKK